MEVGPEVAAAEEPPKESCKDAVWTCGLGLWLAPSLGRPDWSSECFGIILHCHREPPCLLTLVFRRLALLRYLFLKSVILEPKPLLTVKKQDVSQVLVIVLVEFTG